MNFYTKLSLIGLAICFTLIVQILTVDKTTLNENDSELSIEQTLDSGPGEESLNKLESLAPKTTSATFETEKNSFKSHTIVSKDPSMDERTVLWQFEDSHTMDSSREYYEFEIDVKALGSINVGQVVALNLPGDALPFISTITETKEATSKTQVWKGVDEASQKNNLIVTRGPIATHITILADSNTYSAIIDNKSGEVRLTNEGILGARAIPFDDGIPAPVPNNLHQHNI